MQSLEVIGVQVPVCAVCLLRMSVNRPLRRKEASSAVRLLLLVTRGAEIGPIATKPRLEGVEVKLQEFFDRGER
jgi:hypothetical protein